MTPPEFLIRHAALDAIIAHARAARPAECCGMLLGTAASIEEAIQARNIASGPTRFLIDPHDHIEARRVARGRGVEVIGFYHSHPYSPPLPSPTDIAEATYPEAVYLIVSLAGAAPNARLFRIERGAAVELPLRSIG
jgi:proteasome lid subunit RPN8/RPN11